MAIEHTTPGFKQQFSKWTAIALLLAPSVVLAAPTCSVTELAPDDGSSGVTAIGDKGQVGGWTRSAPRGIYSTVLWRGLQAEVLNSSLPTCSYTEGPVRISAISPNETFAGTLSNCDVSRGTYWVKVKGEDVVQGPRPLSTYGNVLMPTGVSDAGSVVGLIYRDISSTVINAFASGRSHAQIETPSISGQVGAGNGGLTALASGWEAVTFPPSSVQYSGAAWIDGEQAKTWAQSKPMMKPSDTFQAIVSAARATWVAADEVGESGSAVVVLNRITGAESSRFLPAKLVADYRLNNAILSASGQWLSFSEKPRSGLPEQTIYLVQLRNGKPQGSPRVVADVFSHTGGVIAVSDQGHVVARLMPQPLPFVPPQWYVSLPSGAVVKPVDLVPGLSQIDKVLMNRRGAMAVEGVYNGRTSALRMTCTD